jgi:hypothetical protein
VASRRTVTPIAEIMPDRCTPEYERTLARMGALLPYRRACTLIEEFFPVGDAAVIETVRQRTLNLGARLERKAVSVPTSDPPTEAQSITLSIDGGPVRSVRSYQVQSSEIFVAQVGNCHFPKSTSVVCQSPLQRPAAAETRSECSRNSGPTRI